MLPLGLEGMLKVLPLALPPAQVWSWKPGLADTQLPLSRGVAAMAMAAAERLARTLLTSILKVMWCWYEQTSWRGLRLVVMMSMNRELSGQDQLPIRGLLYKKRRWPGITYKYKCVNVYAMLVLVSCPRSHFPFQRGSGVDGIFHLYEAWPCGAVV